MEIKIIKTAVLLVVLALLSSYLYVKYLFYSFPERALKAHTPITHYKVLSKAHDDEQWYIKVLIDKADGEQLLKLYPFEYGSNPVDSAGALRNTFIEMTHDQWYYFNNKGMGQYEYVLFSLNKEKTILEIYDQFGD